MTCAVTVNAQSGNTGYGENALDSITSGSYNSAFWTNALTADTSGEENTAVGNGALGNSTTGNSNTAIGDGALVFNLALTKLTVRLQSIIATETEQRNDRKRLIRFG